MVYKAEFETDTHQFDTMDRLFLSLKGLFKKEDTCIDNAFFRLHYRFTFLCLIACSLLVTGRQYIGDPIECLSKDAIPPKLLDTFCWIHTTFSIDNAWYKKVGVEIPYPGVDKTGPNQTRTYHAYYQWVFLILFLQALFFYLPHTVWRTIEGGRVQRLILELDSPILSSEKKIQQRALLVDYLQTHRGQHRLLWFGYLLAEIMNFINVICQMVFMNRFLGGLFLTYGTRVWSFVDWDWSIGYDPMMHVFPKMAKCLFHKYGPSGDVQRYDVLCLLPINVINEKIYLFLWIWCILLTVCSSLALVYRVALMFSPRLRIILLQARARFSYPLDLAYVTRQSSLGDYLLITLLAKNLEPLNFKEVMSDLALEEDPGEMKAI